MYSGSHACFKHVIFTFSAKQLVVHTRTAVGSVPWMYNGSHACFKHVIFTFSAKQLVVHTRTAVGSVPYGWMRRNVKAICSIIDSLVNYKKAFVNN